MKLSLLQQLKGGQKQKLFVGGLAGVIPASNRNFSRTPGIPRALVYHSVTKTSLRPRFGLVFDWLILFFACPK